MLQSSDNLAEYILKKLASVDIDRSKINPGFASKSQQRLFFALEDRGELPKGKALEWAHDTPDIKKLPEKVG